MAEAKPEKQREARSALAPLEGSPTDMQDIPGWSGRIMVWLRWATQIIGIQALMLAGLAVGLVIVGAGPAFVAGSALTARLVRGEPSDRLWSDFWVIYRVQLRRAAMVIGPALVVLAVAWYELLVLQAHGTTALTAILTGTTAAVGLYSATYLAYAPVVVRRYRDPTWPTIRFVLVAPLVSPLTALGCVVTVVAVTLIGVRWPLILLLTGLAIPTLLTGLLVERFLDRVDARDDDNATDG